MSTYRDREGTWCLYDYDTGSYIISVHRDIVDAALRASQQAYGKVLFWPFEMARDEAIEWWNEVKEDLSDSIVHFYYNHYLTLPFCEAEVQDEWVQFDHTAVGKICIFCQQKLNREIQ